MPPTSDSSSAGPKARPIAAIGKVTLACAIAITIASVAARWRSEAPRPSIIVSVAIGAAKLTRLICSAANTPSPVSPAGRSSGASRATTQSSTPRASSRRISDSITTMIGSSTKSESSTAERPAWRMIWVSWSMDRERISAGWCCSAKEAP